VLPRLDRQAIDARLSPRGIQLLDPYINAQTKYRFKCRNLHVWTSLAAAVFRGTGCPFCAGKRLWKQGVQAKLKQIGVLLIGDYLGIKALHDVQCLNEHTWKASPNGLLNTGKDHESIVCPECRRLNREHDLNRDLEKRGLRLTRAYQFTSKKDTGHECLHCGNQWAGRLDSTCKKCYPKQYRASEEAVRAIIQKLTGKEFKRTYPTWLRGRSRSRGLQLDGYNEELKLAFEYQGRQHYIPVPTFGGQKAFALIHQRDERKRVTCYRKSVTLIRVPYWKKDVEGFIRTKLLQAGFQLADEK